MPPNLSELCQATPSHGNDRRRRAQADSLRGTTAGGPQLFKRNLEKVSGTREEKLVEQIEITVKHFDLLVPEGVPLTSTRDFESCGVDDLMERAITRSDGRRHIDVFVPSR